MNISTHSEADVTNTNIATFSDANMTGIDIAAPSETVPEEADDVEDTVDIRNLIRKII